MCLNWVDCHHQLVKWSSVFGWWWWMWWWWEAPGPVSVLESQFLHESGITLKSVILPRLISGFLFPCPRNTLGRTSVLIMGACDFTAFSKKVQGTNSKEVLSLLELKKLRNSQTNFQNGQTFCISFLVVESVSCSSSSRIARYGFYLLGMCRIWARAWWRTGRQHDLQSGFRDPTTGEKATTTWHCAINKDIVLISPELRILKSENIKQTVLTISRR